MKTSILSRISYKSIRGNILMNPFNGKYFHLYNIMKYNKKFSDSNFVNITYKYLSGKEVHVQAPIGENLLIIAKNNNVELEGACDCSLACSTCHLILDNELYSKLDEPSEDETNLLSLSGNYCETSRLGCQIIASSDLEGRIFKIPFDPI